MGKNKVKNAVALFTVALCVGANFMLSGCFDSGKTQPPDDDDDNKQSVSLDDEPEFEENVIANFQQGSYNELFAVADGFSNGDVFNVEWDADAIKYTDDGAQFTISRKPDDDQGNAPEVPYFGAGMNSHNYYGYGFYSAEMKPSGVDGTCTAFFTYTGQYDTDAEGNPHPNPHDEIDIEFLGKDTTRVQFNYFVNGEGDHEYWHDLGFDASKEYHTYGFYWAADRITWYVDGEAVYKVEASEDNPLPATAGRIMMNHWSGTEKANSWMGEYKGETSEAVFRSVSVTGKPLDISGQEIVPETGNFEFDATSSNLPLTSTGSSYQLTTSDNGGSYSVGVEGIVANSYENITNSSDIAELMSGKNAFAFKISNEGQKRLNVRVDIIDTTIETSYEDASLPKHQCINYLAYKDNIKADTDYEWGGTSFVVEPGATNEVVVIYKGIANKIAFFLDSSLNSGETRNVDATLSEFEFGIAEGEGIPEPEEPQAPVLPFDLQLSDAQALAFNEGTSGYALEEKDGGKAYGVTYTAIKANSYQNISDGTSIKKAAENMNAFSMVVQNNSDRTLSVKVDIIDSNIQSSYDDPSLPNHKCINYVAYQDNVKAATDLEWGGSSFVIGAKKTSTILVIFDGNADSLLLYFDSHLGTDIVSDGNLEISQFRFGVATGEDIPLPAEPVKDPFEAAPPVSLDFTEVSEGYNVQQNSDKTDLNVTYTDMTQSWKNVGANIAITTVQNAFSVKIKNNGNVDVAVRINMIAVEPVGANNASANISATYNGSSVNTDTEWGGSYFVIPANSEGVAIVWFNAPIYQIQFMIDSFNAGTFSGDVTFSEFKLLEDPNGPVIQNL